MTMAFVQFAVASTVLVAAAIVLTRFADTFARATRLGHLFVGSILLAGATSLPELSVNISIIKLDMPNMAVGGLLGSSLFNLGILALADLTHKARGYVFSRRSVETALAGVVSIGMTAIVGVGIFTGGVLESNDLAGLGISSLVLLTAYLLGIRLIYHDQLSKTARAAKPAASGRMSRKRSAIIVRSLAGFAVSTIIILVTAPYSASAAGEIAEASGLGNTFIGTTLVALATSLPELVTCISAVRMGAMSLAIGNIFGSNTFNLVLLVPLDLVHPGPLIESVSVTHVLTCMLVVVITATAIIGQLYRVETRKMFVEPDAALILLLVAAGMILVYFCN